MTLRLLSASVTLTFDVVAGFVWRTLCILSRSDARDLPLSVSKQPLSKTSWLVLSQKISHKVKKHVKALSKVASWHWSLPTAGLQFRAPNSIFQIGPESSL